MVVRAPYKDGNISDEGSVYAFTLQGEIFMEDKKFLQMMGHLMTILRVVLPLAEIHYSLGIKEKVVVREPSMRVYFQETDHGMK